MIYYITREILTKIIKIDILNLLKINVLYITKNLYSSTLCINHQATTLLSIWPYYPIGDLNINIQLDEEYLNIMSDS